MKKPDGTETEETKEYIDSWMEPAKLFCEKTGATIIGCDPDFSFDIKGCPVSLSYDALIALLVAMV